MNQNPMTLNDAIAGQPAWLQVWVTALVVVHLLALLQIARRTESGWRPRYEAIAIITSFVLSAAFMGWLFEQVGYVRLLGLPHLIFWTPVYAWMVIRVRQLGVSSLFGKYLVLYLAVAGISLVIDAVDVTRHLLGVG